MKYVLEISSRHRILPMLASLMTGLAVTFVLASFMVVAHSGLLMME